MTLLLVYTLYNMMLIENEYNIGEIVYLKTDHEQRPRMVCAISIRAQHLMYALAFGTMETWHTNIEIQKEKNVLSMSE